MSAVKATFVNSEMGTITVNEYSASQIKPTLFQVSTRSFFRCQVFHAISLTSV